MYVESLQEIGLTPNESKIYNALLDLKEASIWHISERAGVHRRNAYDAIQRLMAKGLAFQVLPKKTLTYSPVHPEKLRELMEEKFHGLESALPGLVRRFERKEAMRSMFVYRGLGGLKNLMGLIIKEGKDIYGLGSKGTWFDKRITPFALRAGKLYKKKGIKNRIIFDHELKESHDVLSVLGRPYKFLPKKYSTGSSVDIFGDYIAIYSGVSVKSLDQDITIFILKDKTLARDYMKWWHFMWDHLPVEK